MDISVIISFHREGHLAEESLWSLLQSAQVAACEGVSIEVIATLDCADQKTIDVVSAFDMPFPLTILPLELGDLGLVRNAAVSHGCGKATMIMDGDDLISQGFLRDAWRRLTEPGDSSRVIMRPGLIVFFGSTWGAARQVASSSPDFRRESLLLNNPWTSCCFAWRQTFASVPYSATTSRGNGFGYEDWHWNCQTLAMGYTHEIETESTHFVRRKPTAYSLSRQQIVSGALFPETELFGP